MTMADGQEWETCVKGLVLGPQLHRVEACRVIGKLLQSRQLSQEYSAEIPSILFSRCLFYDDTASRRAVRDLIRIFCSATKFESIEFKRFHNTLLQKSATWRLSAASAFTILRWSCVWLDEILKDPTKRTSAVSILQACGDCTETFVRTQGGHASMSRPSRLQLEWALNRVLHEKSDSAFTLATVVQILREPHRTFDLARVTILGELTRVCDDDVELSTHFNEHRIAAYTTIIAATLKPLGSSLQEVNQSTTSEQTPINPRLARFLPIQLWFKQLLQILDASKLKGVGPTEVGILRTPETEAFTDVLDATSQGRLPPKGSKDYDAAKWEAEMRAELAKKNGQQRKFAPKEREKVNAQIAKEAVIRDRVNRVKQELEVGIGILRIFSILPSHYGLAFLPRGLDLLLEIIRQDQSGLLENQAESTFVALSRCLGDRPEPVIARELAIVSLRTITGYKAGETEPDLAEAVSNILYKLRFAAEEKPFDAEVVAYALPLLSFILQNGGAGEKSSEKADEQIVLAIEFLTFQSESLGLADINRLRVFHLLIYALEKYAAHHQSIRDCFTACVREAADSLKAEEMSVLLAATLATKPSTRAAALHVLSNSVDLSKLDSPTELWVAYHDEFPENAEHAQQIWDSNGLDLGDYSAGACIPYLQSKDAQLRGAAARALAEALEYYPDMFDPTLSTLKVLYREKAEIKVQKYDRFGMPIKMDLSDPWEGRHGIALAFEAMKESFPALELPDFMSFLIQDGPLSDSNSTVRSKMLDAAKAMLDVHGEDRLEKLMTLYEQTLESSQKDSVQSDLVAEAIIILYGTLASYLPAQDGRSPKIIDQLIQALKTPAESVQAAVADCLPPLFREVSGQARAYLTRLLDDLQNTKSYAVRRGSAYGLAAFIKGRGIAAFKEFRIMMTLKGALEDKKNPPKRQAALVAYELQAQILKHSFEPYIIQIVPHLLSSFGDSNLDVREACLDAAKACFANLTPYGVQRILPTLLEGLDEDQWRSKKGACDLLGAMAYLDPEQLARSLPDIIPPLTTVLNDSHKEVRLAGNKSLQRFGEVIKNPEIKSLVPTLLKALSDPTKNTEIALDALIKTAFLHYLDAPSLALVVRILERGLRDRSATKRKSAQIIGSLTYLTERKDMTVHLSILTNGLKLAIVDPVPTTRATASKSLGSLVEKLGEDALPTLIPDLMHTLKSETSAGDRLGSAQALSEVLAGLGTSRLEETLPLILANVSSSKPSVREGFMTLFLYLPICFGTSFSPYLGTIIPPILSGLADEAETIRETALTSGRLLVKNFASRSVDLLLPELEKGLMDDNYRIRLSSVELVGDLLFSLTGISSKTGDEEEDFSRPEASASLKSILGPEKRDRVLSLLYICRCDTSITVRTAAIAVWKALVRTPRTLKELVPTLTSVIIQRLASNNLEQRQIAGNSLAELIRKAGEGVITTLLPILKRGLQTSDAAEKGAVCVALKELLTSAAQETLEENQTTLISVVRVALVDPRSEVREAAADAFDSLQQSFGRKAIDEIVPDMLRLLESTDEANASLSALLTLLGSQARSNMILPTLLPTLLRSPISRFNARAIGALSQVASSSLNRRLTHVLGGLIDNIVAAQDVELKAELRSAFDTVMLSLDEDDGLNGAVPSLFQYARADDHRKRAEADDRMRAFFSSTELDYSRYIPDFIRVLLTSFDDRDPDVVRAAHGALIELITKLRKEDMPPLVASTRQALGQTGTPGHQLPGFKIPKGLNAVLPVFVQGLLTGSGDTRIEAAWAINDLVDKAGPDALKPTITVIAGPLIRVVTEKTIDLKAAILFVLNNLLLKVPIPLKPFLPQLQRSFARALAEPGSEAIRNRAARALGTLITLTPKIDPLIAELGAGTQSPEPSVRSAMLQALFEVVSKVGGAMVPQSHTIIYDTLTNGREEDDESSLIVQAKLLGAYSIHASPEIANNLVAKLCLSSEPSRRTMLNLNALLLDSPGLLTKDDVAEKMMESILTGMRSRSPDVSAPAVLASGKYLLSPSLEPSAPYQQAKEIFGLIAQISSPQMMPDVSTRRLALVIVRTVSRLRPSSIRPHQGVLAPAVFTCVRDPVVPVKLAAEAAFVALFDLMNGEDVFKKYANGLPQMEMVRGRIIGEWIRRSGAKIAADKREGKETSGATGDEDEEEIWSVGKVDVGADQPG